MGDIREKAWAFSIAGGILALLAFLTPTAYLSDYTGSFNVWMWGLVSFELYGYGSITTFTDNPSLIGISAVCSILVIISIIAMIGVGASSRNSGYSGGGWVAPSILMFLATIGYIAGYEMTYLEGIGYSFWSTVNPGFGIIGIFLGGIISIIGYGVTKVQPQPTREAIFPVKKDFIRSNVRSSTSTFKFCPSCGHDIIKPDQKFCIECGFQFENVPEVTEEFSFEAVSTHEPITIPPETREGGFKSEGCENCELSRKLGREECIWCGKKL
jgi:hypothetical protein